VVTSLWQSPAFAAAAMIVSDLGIGAVVARVDPMIALAAG
jgi:hypothetical protein